MSKFTMMTNPLNHVPTQRELTASPHELLGEKEPAPWVHTDLALGQQVKLRDGFLLSSVVSPCGVIESFLLDKRGHRMARVRLGNLDMPAYVLLTDLEPTHESQLRHIADA